MAVLLIALGALAVLAGAVVYFACVYAFAAAGRGTPAFWDPPLTLIGGRWFRIVRNPMYIGVDLMIFGQGLWWGSPATMAWAAVVALAFHTFVVLYEEPHLRRRFVEESHILPRCLDIASGH